MTQVSSRLAKVSRNARSVITRVRPAGTNEFGDHQVVTVTGGDSNYCRRPCATCPWRVDAVGQFPPEAFKHSAGTAYDQAMNTFACHVAGTEKTAICAGFLLRGADHNIAVRLKLMKGDIDPDAVSTGGIELHDSYRAMAIANGVAADDPALAPCRR